MSKILCEKHGKSFIAQVCCHIEAAIKKRERIDIVKIREELFGDEDCWIYHYCRECASKLDLKNDTIYSDIDEHKTSILSPICGKCFENWKKDCL